MDATEIRPPLRWAAVGTFVSSSLRDAVIPAAIAALGAVELVGLHPPGLPAAVALESGACLLLVFRRRWPLAVCAAAGVLPMLLPFIGPELNEPATPILILALAGFSLARYLTDLRGTVVVGAFVMLLSGDVLLTSDDSDLSNVVFVAAVLLPPYGFGLVTRALADRNRKLAEQAELLSRLQEAVKREAVAAERTRIARELHDVIAHSISAMIVQASAARELIGGDERRAAIALDAVTSAGRRALQETGRLLHLIRE